ncbi:MAG: acetate/propionate family kinase [Treponemataceae bacterium]
MMNSSRNVLVLNCGSTTIKFQLLNTLTGEALFKGAVDRVGRSDCSASYRKGAEGPKQTEDLPGATHAEALRWVFGILPSDLPLYAVGHRVVHGGSFFSGPALVDEETLRKIEECSPLAPLHNPIQLAGIRACMVFHPGIPHVASFDTAFHQNTSAVASLVPLPHEVVACGGYRKFGFHGASHRYVSERAAVLLGRERESLRLVTCHLGGGSSVTAVRFGVAIDTTATFGTFTGMPMGTRPGDIDGGIILDLFMRQGMDAPAVHELLYKKSGLAAISGVSGDMAELERLEAEGHEGAALAREYYIYCLKKFIGSFAAAMEGVDGIVFTAGIGENDADLRARLCGGLLWLGARLDGEKNLLRGKDRLISTPDSEVALMVIPTNEELAIALEVAGLLGKR